MSGAGARKRRRERRADLPFTEDTAKRIRERIEYLRERLPFTAGLKRYWEIVATIARLESKLTQLDNGERHV